MRRLLSVARTISASLLVLAIVTLGCFAVLGAGGIISDKVLLDVIECILPWLYASTFVFVLISFLIAIQTKTVFTQPWRFWLATFSMLGIAIVAADYFLGWTEEFGHFLIYRALRNVFRITVVVLVVSFSIRLFLRIVNRDGDH